MHLPFKHKFKWILPKHEMYCWRLDKYKFILDFQYQNWHILKKDALLKVRVTLDPKMNGGKGTNLSCTEVFVLMWKCHKASADFWAVPEESKEA